MNVHKKTERRWKFQLCHNGGLVAVEVISLNDWGASGIYNEHSFRLQMLGRNPVENFRWKDDLSEPEMTFPVSFVVALQASQPLAVRVSATGCYGVRLTLGDRLDEQPLSLICSLMQPEFGPIFHPH